MAKGEQQVRLRKPSTREVVATRTARRLAKLKPATLPEGVQPLNPGYFLLEAMRTHPGVRLKKVKKAKPK